MLITVCIFIRYNAVTKYITGDQDNDVRFDVFMVVKIQVIQVVMPCSVVLGRLKIMTSPNLCTSAKGLTHTRSEMHERQ
jgi:hypothetical protein